MVSRSMAAPAQALAHWTRSSWSSSTACRPSSSFDYDVNTRGMYTYKKRVATHCKAPLLIKSDRAVRGRTYSQHC
eukprot:COSAG02_NODE_5037_length_4704_cov_2.206253_1_plen_75_part_00